MVYMKGRIPLFFGIKESKRTWCMLIARLSLKTKWLCKVKGELDLREKT
jgi:hypothetical protein